MRRADLPSLPPERVLLVEPFEAIRRVYERILPVWGLRITSVTRGGEAIRALEADSFSLLLSRTSLPDMHGFELMKRVRERFGILGLALSSIGDTDYVRQSLEAGYSRHLIMPVSFDELHAAISELLLESTEAKTGPVL